MRGPAIGSRPTVELRIPEPFSRLRDIAYNLWWSWSPQAHRLFNRIDSQRWLESRNPVELLVDLEPHRWAVLEENGDFIQSYRALVQDFDDYVDPERETWFDRTFPDYREGPIVYFSTEFGWHESLQTYSGGLGILAGDHTKTASDLGLPFLGIGLMYKHGYFRQTIDADGHQQHFYPDHDFQRLPVLPAVDADGEELRVEVELPGRTVQLKVWIASVGRVPVLLLDTDLPANDPADRPITSILYVNGREMRLCQELVLGFGGVESLKALAISPAVWHINEGHSALLSVRRVLDLVEQGRLPLAQACQRVRSNTLFTTHTPVPAGNETFEIELAKRYLAGWAERDGLDLEALVGLGRSGDAGDGSFNLTTLALRTCRWANGVSQRHGEVARAMWSHLQDVPPIEHVTNGVHVATWLGPECGELLRRHLGADFLRRLLDPELAAALEGLPDEELWAAHVAQKRRLVTLARQRLLEQFARHGRSPAELREVDRLLDPGALLVGFARRFATYKRGDLLLLDAERLKALVTSAERPVQFLFAGKAHPADRPGQELIHRIWQASLRPELRGRLLFLEDYDMRLGRALVQGVDVWVNTPRRPQEASGTSGMKVAMNGGLNCSILDGWWCEGYDAAHGWTIGRADGPEDAASQDREDAESLYATLADAIAPCFYRRGDDGLPTEWIQRMKRAIALLLPRFSSARMVREYCERYYVPAGRRAGDRGLADAGGGDRI
ncbi:MAG TPA: alpha-glucan family phosphorylase [Candidatus Polarisedimenticolaceae bacterium]|nr:alpha-glucan family phosphorylase [Candidatus Polarisedimenticolaceae bacterium]